jgi:hypothetical protein
MAENEDLAIEAITEAILLQFQVVMGLQIQPEPIGRLKVPRQSQRRVGGNRALPTDDFVDPPRRDADVLGQTILADAKRAEKLLKKYLAGMDWR